MSSASLPHSLLGEFARNQRLVVGAVITFIHTSLISFLLLENPSQPELLIFVSLPTLLTIVIPFLITEKVIMRFCKEESLEAHLRTLAKTTGETPEAVEVELSADAQEDLPEELEEPDSVKIVDEELLDHVDGDVFDPIDADARGVVAIGFASILIIPSAPILGILLDGMIPILIGAVIAVLAGWLVLQQHRDMVELIEYTPYTVDT